MAEARDVRSIVEPLDDILKGQEELELLAEMATEDPAAIPEMETVVLRMEQHVEQLDFRVMLGGPNDRCGAYVQFTPGAGGVDAADWAGLLLRMYVRWAEKKGYKVEVVDQQPG